jgi:hypothetical protein
MCRVEKAAIDAADPNQEPLTQVNMGPGVWFYVYDNQGGRELYDHYIANATRITKGSIAEIPEIDKNGLLFPPPGEPAQVVLFGNGLIAVFDATGKQIPQYLGRLEEKRPKLEELPGELKWYVHDLRSGQLTQISKEKMLHGTSTIEEVST